ncbi:MAG: hypothetical protein ACXVX1_08435 [Mycobacterium sp.]
MAALAAGTPAGAQEGTLSQLISATSLALQGMASPSTTPTWAAC